MTVSELRRILESFEQTAEVQVLVQSKGLKVADKASSMDVTMVIFLPRQNMVKVG